MWARYLHFLSQQQDVVFSIPASVRTEKQKNTISCAVNTFLLRSTANLNKSFLEFVETQISPQVAAIRKFRAVPFSTISTSCYPEISSIRRPNCFFGFQRTQYPMEALGAHFCQVGNISGNSIFGKSPVSSLFIQDRSVPFQIALLVGYSSQQDIYFARMQVSNIALGYASQWVREFVDFSERQLHSPHLQLQTLPVSLGITYSSDCSISHSYARDRYSRNILPTATIGEFLVQSCTSFCGRTIVCEENVEYTYGAVLACSRNMAALVGKNKVIATLFQKDIEHFIAPLVIWLSESTYLPLDFNSPLTRLRSIVSQAKPSAVLASPECIDRAKEICGHIQCISMNITCDGKLQFYSDIQSVYSSQKQNSHIAYIMFTSGTTGIPKGIMVSHKNVLCLLHSVLDEFRPFLQPCAKHSLWTPPHFDVFVFEILLSAFTGGCTCICPATVKHHKQDFSRWILMNNIATSYIPPSFIRDFSTVVGSMDQETIEKSELKILLTGTLQ